MGSSLVFLHVVRAFEDLEALRAFSRFSIHVLHSDVTRQVYLCYQLSAIWAGFFACNKHALIFGSENLVHGSLMLPQVVNALEYFLTNMASFWSFSSMLNSHMTTQVGFPHLFLTMWTDRHHASYNREKTS